MRWAVCLLIVSMLWLSACKSFAPIVQSQEVPSPSPRFVTEEPAAGGMIVFERSGGFAGIQESWYFYRDGRVVREVRRQLNSAPIRIQTQLPPDAVQDAVQKIVDGGFLDLAEEYMPENRCCDRFTYRLTIIFGGEVKTVTTMDGAEQPQALAEALKTVNKLIEQVIFKP